jgi:Tol biopolymer transport system component
MDTLGLFWSAKSEMKVRKQSEREGGRKAFERGRTRSRGQCAVVLGALAFVLLLISVPSPPAVYATFPGANGKILFESTRDGGDFDIFTMNPDGSGVTQLTNNSGIEDRLASWSADGLRIAYSSTQDGGDFDIWVMNADGSGKTQLTFNSAVDELPVWSPDGAKIAFGGTQDGDYEVYTMNADGAGQTQLTFNSILDFGPAWSPDGATIAFQSGVNQSSGLEIWKMNADGSGMTQLTSNSFQDTSVSWAPDGSKMLFRRDLGFGSGWGEVFSMNADGTGQTNITNTATIFDSEGRYSPDGTKIVFTSNEDDPGFEVWVMNADGTGRTRLTTSAGNDIGDDWQPLVLYDFSGFFQPIDNPPTVNVVNAGSAIPVKFSLSGDKGLSIFAAGYPASQQIACIGGIPVDDIEETMTAGNSSLSYDPTTDRYNYVWKTERGWRGTCRQLVVKLNDGSTHVANFQFR